MDKVQFKVGDRVLIKRAFEDNEAVVGTYGTVVCVSQCGRVSVDHDVESPIMLRHGVMVGITHSTSINIWS